MEVRIEESWKKALEAEWEKPYFAALASFVRNRYASGPVFPPAGSIFAAFDACPFEDVKVVILGQDPYHGVGQANGLCFSVADGIEFPPSLANIFKEMLDDVGAPGQTMPASGDLSYLARQGVLLLNATLTVDAHRAGSHQGQGWETFTDAVIAQLNSTRQNLCLSFGGHMPYAKEALSTGTGTLCLLRLTHRPYRPIEDSSATAISAKLTSIFPNTA